MKKTLAAALTLLLLCAFAFGAPAVAETAPEETAAPEESTAPEETAAPVEYAVSVGDVRYTKEIVQFSLSSLADAFLSQGGSVTMEDARTLVDETIEHFVQLGVIENRLRERGLDQFTQDELDYYREYALQMYESLWQNGYQMLKQENSAVTEEQVSDWLNAHGYTIDMFYEDALGTARMSRALDNYCQETTVSFPELVDFYTERYVQPDREKYEHDVKRYEREILAQNSEAFFTPAGYRYIKHILLPIPDEVQSQLDEISLRGEKAAALRDEAYDALAEAAAGGEEIAPYKAEYDARVAAVEALGEEYLVALRGAVPALKEKTDEIYRRYEAGESFETLMTDYSADSQQQRASDPGYLFHPDSENWAGDFHDAAAALEKPGDISQPVATTAGVHIICYMADAPSGVHQLTAMEQEALEATALREKKLEALGDLVDIWVGDYEVETHPEMIDISEYIRYYNILMNDEE